MKRFLDWCKAEVVLCIAMLLAVVSAVFVTPDRQYLDYIDFRTLGILFCLMAIMAGLQKIGLFHYIAEWLLDKVQHMRGVIFVLIMLCFFTSMFITNDVALITFVPFTFIVLKLVLKDESGKLVVPIVVMQTIAANLGSMLTPIGNPQNLYLFGKTTMSFWEFMLWMLPYTVISFGLLALWCLFFPYRGPKKLQLTLEKKDMEKGTGRQLIIYGMLFVLCLFTVAHVVPWTITIAVVVGVVLIVDCNILGKVDYALLFTFIGFFVFIGNMGRIPVFYHMLQRIIEGNEVLTSVVSSQFISNVPAALLLSGFTNQYDALIVGTNLGGLGTLIASMASLISFKYIGKEYKHLRGKYLLSFTIANLIFLAVLLGFEFMKNL